MEIYVFNKDIEFKGILEDYFSLIWTRRYSKSGEFEIHCNFKEGMQEFLKEDDIVWKNNSDEAGFIEFINIKEDSEGREIYIIKGKFLTSYLARRIIWGKATMNSTTENVIRELITVNAITPANVDRKIDLFKLGDIKNIGNNINYQASYRNLLEEVEGIALSDGLGIKTRLGLDSKRIYFELYIGLDRTTEQSINPRAIFSKEFENVLEQEYISTINDYKTVALVAGEGEGNARQLEIVGGGIGLNRHELYVDARDLQSTKMVNDEEVTMSDSEYKKILENRGYSKLAETTRIESFDSTVDLDSNLIYKVDFDLGDIVTCLSQRWGLLINTRITEIQEIYEDSGFRLNIVFGEETPDIIQKIKREVR